MMGTIQKFFRFLRLYNYTGTQKRWASAILNVIVIMVLYYNVNSVVHEAFSFLTWGVVLGALLLWETYLLWRGYM